jgi:hypothetical protein
MSSRPVLISEGPHLFKIPAPVLIEKVMKAAEPPQRLQKVRPYSA